MHQVIYERTLYFHGLRTFSVNASYVNAGRGRAKSSGLTEWCGQFFNLLASTENQEKVADLRANFDAQKHVYHIEILVSTPDLYTAKGEVSTRTHDCSNFEKGILDCLMLPKYNDEPVPYGCANLNLDDKFVTRLVSEKVPSLHRNLSVTVKIVARP
jgi:hypothetical protein